ncbi:thioredoxin family protein [Desulfosporosinus sp. BG]|uniref:thioredoxin family protein n=1 Tax=Desulfosporosinus sp. BG TaxID=1633135 RepID=UPI00085684B5|nr:thioredoxin family protein [Desulfosporosinus sp. BG]ODA39936.1 Thioredoxin [Desulfosporosinus sp. BG]
MEEPINIKTDSLIQTYDHLKQLLAEEEQVILYFSSRDCNVCHAVLPKLMNLVNDHSIKVVKIDINEHVEIAGQLLIFTVPTILIMYDGREVLRESRFIDLQKVERMLNSF